jgi:hypothetical protein
MSAVMKRGGRHGYRDCEARRAGATCRGGDPFRWCVGGPPVRAEWCSAGTSDNRVDDDFEPDIHEAKIWVNGSVFTLEIEASGEVNDTEYMQMVVNAVEAARRDKEKK